MTRSDRFMWECSGIPSVEATVSLISISLNDSSTHPLGSVRDYRNLWTDYISGLRLDAFAGIILLYEPFLTSKIFSNY